MKKGRDRETNRKKERERKKEKRERRERGEREQIKFKFLLISVWPSKTDQMQCPTFPVM